MKTADVILNILTGSGLAMAVFGCGVVLSVRLRAAADPKKLIKALRGGSGDMPPAKAMCVALAGTLGVGNIAGVASAISIGGAGAVFWMWVSAIFAMVIKYAETLLALKHRRRSDGWHGGAFFYMQDRGTKPSKLAARIFALLCLSASLTIGSSIQSNAAATCLNKELGVDTRLCGVLFGIGALAVISGGFGKIADFIVTAVPAASIGYTLISFYIIFTNISYLPGVIGEIISGAVGAEAFAGGITGFLTSKALSLGVTRGIVSNEAGCGTAPIAHSSSDVKEPAAQGVFGMLEVFIDTILLCSLTAFVVLIAKARGLVLPTDGMEAAIAAFGEFLPFSGIFLSASVTLFAFATVICWFYYGSESLRFLNCPKGLYRFVFAAATAVGAFSSGGVLWRFSDLTIDAMTLLNLFYVMRYLPEIKRETDSYFGKDG